MVCIRDRESRSLSRRGVPARKKCPGLAFPRAALTITCTCPPRFRCPAIGETVMLRTRLFFRSVLVVLGLLPGTPGASAEEPRPPKGFVALFNGKSLAGWHGMA